MSDFHDIWLNSERSSDSDDGRGGGDDSTQPLLSGEPSPNDMSKEITMVNLTVLKIKRLTEELFSGRRGSLVNLSLSPSEINQKRKDLAKKRFVVNNKLKAIMEWLQNTEVRRKLREENDKKKLARFKRIQKKFLEEKEYQKFKDVLKNSIEKEKEYLSFCEKQSKKKDLSVEIKNGEEGEEEEEDEPETLDSMKTKRIENFDYQRLAGTSYGEILDEEMKDIEVFSKDMDELEDIYTQLQTNLAKSRDVIVNIQGGKLEKIARNTDKATEKIVDTKDIQKGTCWMTVCVVILIVFIFGLICCSVFLIFFDFSIITEALTSLWEAVMSKIVDFFYWMSTRFENFSTIANREALITVTEEQLKVNDATQSAVEDFLKKFSGHLADLQTQSLDLRKKQREILEEVEKHECKDEKEEEEKKFSKRYLEENISKDISLINRMILVLQVDIERLERKLQYLQGMANESRKSIKHNKYLNSFHKDKPYFKEAIEKRNKDIVELKEWKREEIELKDKEERLKIQKKEAFSTTEQQEQEEKEDEVSRRSVAESE